MRLLWLLLVVCLSFPLAACGQNAGDEEDNKDPLSSGTFADFEFRNIGPALMSGRIADIEIVQDDPATWYVGVGSGGVWKTVNAGTTWTPLFDKEASYSIGEIALDPSDVNTIWVGTGENTGGRHNGFGDCLLYTSPSPRDRTRSRMPSSA